MLNFQLSLHYEDPTQKALEDALANLEQSFQLGVINSEVYVKMHTTLMLAISQHRADVANLQSERTRADLEAERADGAEKLLKYYRESRKQRY